MKDRNEDRKRALDDIDTNEEDLDLNPEEEQDAEYDINQEDKLALGQDDLSLDGGEDEELLLQREDPVDFTGEDLDIPGSELDDEQERIGKEDEENNHYSLGSEDNENLERGDS
jgi:hypothetical protein